METPEKEAKRVEVGQSPQAEDPDEKKARLEAKLEGVREHIRRLSQTAQQPRLTKLSPNNVNEKIAYDRARFLPNPHSVPRRNTSTLSSPSRPSSSLVNRLRTASYGSIASNVASTETKSPPSRRLFGAFDSLKKEKGTGEGVLKGVDKDLEDAYEIARRAVIRPFFERRG